MSEKPLIKAAGRSRDGVFRVWVRGDVYEAMEKEASAQGVTVHEYCERLLRNHVKKLEKGSRHRGVKP